MTLGVWLRGQPVATLTARRPWQLSLRYHDAVLDAGEANRIVLSCSMPVSRGRHDAGPWVRGLLPEGAHLLALAQRARTTTNDFAGLIDRYGRDIAGACTIGSEPDDPDAWSVEPYTRDELADEVRLVSDVPGLGVRDDSELSLAGMQNKLLVVALADGAWGRPVRGHPSTHIMKLDDGRFDGLLAAEHACMQLAASVGLTHVSTELLDVDGLSVLAVERYDRRIDAESGAIERLHQEDACQALATNIDAERGRGKYQAHGGPTFAQIADLIDRYGTPADDLPQLVQIAAFTWLIGNADAHGKNLSFLIDDQAGRIRLAPLYDLVPTVLWPQLRSTLAMTVGGVDTELCRDDLVREARSWGLGASAAEASLDDLLEAFSATSIEHEAVAELVERRIPRLR